MRQGNRTILEIFVALSKEPVHKATGKRAEALELTRSGFESQLCHLLAVQPRTIYITKLNLSFLICKIGVVITSSGQIYTHVKCLIQCLARGRHTLNAST